MEKFALLDFLKAFQSLAANNNTEKEPSAPPSPQANPQPPTPPSPQYATYERNAMADVLARHEEIANRIRNKRSV